MKSSPSSEKSRRPDTDPGTPGALGGELDRESGLSITRIESFRRDSTTVVKVTADDGSFGFGQTAPFHNDITQRVLHSMLAPLVLGQDPYRIGELARTCVERNYKFTGSFICRATAGIDTALWDLRGRREGKSVVELLGGAPKTLDVYGSSMSRKITPGEEAERMNRLRDEKGFGGFKIRVGSKMGRDRDAWPGRTEEIIPTVRAALGDGVDLMADANGGYSPPNAIRVGRLLEDHGYRFFEEPCPFGELEWTAETNRALDIDVSGGEQDFDLAQWRRMIRMNAVNIVQPDICYVGGLHRALHVAGWAAEAEKRCVAHSANLSLLTVFAMHFLAAVPNPAPRLEFGIEESEWTRENFYDPVPEVVDGRVKISGEPGWGIEIRKNWLEQTICRVSEKS